MNKKQKFYKKIEKLMSSTKVKIAALSLLLFQLSSYVNLVYADDFASSTFVKGTKKLLENGSKAIVGLGITITSVLLIFNFVKLQTAEDEGDAKMIKKRIKSILICGILVTCVSGLVSIVMSFYE